MKKLTGQQIRETWIRFYKERGHQQIASASLVPHDDPTLLWINAGVAALKKYFDGSIIPSNPRLVNVQKSIRTNDIENVGRTARHHTFFEMLGNFSIGDYFRAEMLPWALEILTSPEYFGMPVDKLYMTYHPSDSDTLHTWLKAGVNEDHLIPLEGNYWEIGEGPAGPNTEVFFDRGEKYDPTKQGLRLLKEDLDNDRYIEIWGIVFSQYNAKVGVAREDYKELPSKNIDTGAGLERIACVLQETPTNFETDLFMPIIKATEVLSNKQYVEENYMSFRVIADHIRALTFALSDGAAFSNEGRGYVLRRIVRRAMRYGQKLGISEPFLYKLVDTVVEHYKDFYPNLTTQASKVAQSIKVEEEKFIKTLASGEALLRKFLLENVNLSGDDAFKLYDTYGFPIDLTVEIVEEAGGIVDLDRFQVLLDEQRVRARLARDNEGSMNAQSADLLNFTAEDKFHYGNLEEITTTVIGLFKDGVAVDELEEYGEIVVKSTNFYAESGGQIGDQGEISGKNFLASVTDTLLAPHGQHLHFVKVNKGSVQVGDEVTLHLDVKRRRLTMRNHSATHLLDQVLSDVLGGDVHQQGSFVGPNYLRFDINYNGPINEKDLSEIEKRVNELIAAALVQTTKILPIEEAKKTGAKSLFDEKYADLVRVVSFGDYSKEFCGGTHVLNTDEIGLFVIEHERAVAAGVRRIEAKTSLGAFELLKGREGLLNEAKDLLGAGSIQEVNQTIKSNKKEQESLKDELSRLKDKLSSLEANKLKDEFNEVNGVNLLVKHLRSYSRDGLGQVVDALKDEHEVAVIVLSGEDNTNYPLAIYVSDAAQKRGLKAGALMKEVALKLGGSGGGRPGFASGAAKDLTKLSEVKPLVERIING